MHPNPENLKLEKLSLRFQPGLGEVPGYFVIESISYSRDADPSIQEEKIWIKSKEDTRIEFIAESHQEDFIDVLAALRGLNVIDKLLEAANRTIVPVNSAVPHKLSFCDEEIRLEYLDKEMPTGIRKWGYGWFYSEGDREEDYIGLSIEVFVPESCRLKVVGTTRIILDSQTGEVLSQRDEVESLAVSDVFVSKNTISVNISGDNFKIDCTTSHIDLRQAFLKGDVDIISSVLSEASIDIDSNPPRDLTEEEAAAIRDGIVKQMKSTVGVTLGTIAAGLGAIHAEVNRTKIVERQ